MNRNMDSFDDRIDDDLCEIIISYLPIKDKLKYESVSKRFQRLIFNKQKVLRISWREDSVNSLSEHHLLKYREMNVRKLKQLLKKFRFIISIQFGSYFLSPSEILSTITQNCDHLTSIGFDSFKINFEALNEFCLKFGQQLRHISFPSNYKDVDSGGDVIKYLLKHSPNLLSVKSLNNEDLNEFEFKRLKKIKLQLDFRSNYEPFVPVQNLGFLEYMSINLFAKDPNNEFFNELAKLQYLKRLKIECIRSQLGDEFWAKHIETIASNCEGLQCFEFKLIVYDLEEFNPNKCFQSISYFCGLKTLRFRIYCKKPITDLSALKNCKSLVVLKLNLKLIGNIFNGIHLFVPQLKEFSFDSTYGSKMTDKSLESIAKLKYLTHLRLKCSNLDITAKGLKNLIDSCERLKYVNIPIYSRIHYDSWRISRNEEKEIY